jgi:hypothetical protein
LLILHIDDNFHYTNRLIHLDPPLFFIIKYDWVDIYFLNYLK